MCSVYSDVRLQMNIDKILNEVPSEDISVTDDENIMIGLKKAKRQKRRVAKDIKKISGVTIAVAPLSPFLRTFFIAYFIH